MVFLPSNFSRTCANQAKGRRKKNSHEHEKGAKALLSHFDAVVPKCRSDAGKQTRAKMRRFVGCAKDIVERIFSMYLEFRLLR